MKTKVRKSSIQNYHGNVVPNFEGTQEYRIWQYLKHRNCWVSRREIAQDLKMETGTVSARVNSLVAKWHVQESISLSECVISKINVHKVRASTWSKK